VEERAAAALLAVEVEEQSEHKAQRHSLSLLHL
jgi:hypothetical protein